MAHLNSTARLAARLLLIGLVFSAPVSAQSNGFVSSYENTPSRIPDTPVRAPLPTQPGEPNASCFGRTTNEVANSARTMWRGVRGIPRDMVRPANLKWELPIAAATGVLIASVDTDASRRIKSISLMDASGTASDIGLGAEFGAAAGTYLLGCGAGREHALSAGLTALEAMGYAAAEDGILKLAFNREYPKSANAAGRFWHGGKSFPSGHSAISWAFASVIAHEYPDKRWVKWSAYGLAGGVSLLRFPAKKHFPSDILIGGTLGYVTGAYLASH